MATRSGISCTNEPCNLDRFLKAQEADYECALAEIKGGKKHTHWMWYIFPQIDGLGSSPTSKYYSIKSIEEADAFLKHPILGSRLLACAEAVVDAEGRSIEDIFGSPDYLKLQSCATLFTSTAPSFAVFDRVLEKHYHGKRDQKTLHLLEQLRQKNERDGHR